METIERKATANIIYQHKDITTDIAPYLISCSYTDRTEGESDEFEFTVHDKDGAWKDNWRPEKGDTVTAEIHTDEGILKCGTFQVDKQSGSGQKEGGDTVTVKCLAKGVKTDIRTKKSTAHAGKTLKQIAQKVADEHGYKLTGITKDFSIGYVMQYRQTDMAFLHELAEKYGYVFSLRDTTLVFTRIYDLHGNPSVLTITKGEHIEYSFDDDITELYKQGRVRHHNSISKKLIAEIHDTGLEVPNTLELHDRVDNPLQAQEIARAKVYKKQILQVKFTLTVPGNIYLVSGNNIDLAGWGQYDGGYCINEATHSIGREQRYLVNFDCNKLK